METYSNESRPAFHLVFCSCVIVIVSLAGQDTYKSPRRESFASTLPPPSLAPVHSFHEPGNFLFLHLSSGPLLPPEVRQLTHVLRKAIYFQDIDYTFKTGLFRSRKS